MTGTKRNAFVVFIFALMMICMLAIQNDSLVISSTPKTDVTTEVNGSFTAHACERKELTISCKENESIHIVYANFGRLSADICEHRSHFKLNCSANNSLSIVKVLCSGKSNCTVSPNNSIFGDPCPKTSKYLTVTYQCLSGNTIVPPDDETTPDADLITSSMITSSLNRESSTSLYNEFLCKPEETRKVNWTATRPDSTATLPCPNNIELTKARRLCGSKAEWGREVDFSECVSKENLEQQDKLEDLRKNFSLVVVHELMNGLEKASKGLYGGDLVALAKIMVGTVDLTESSSTMNYSDADRINEVVLKKTSMLLHPSNYVSWMELPKTNQSSTATRLLRSVESSLTILAKSLNGKRNFSRKTLVYPGIEAWVYVLEHNTENSISTPYSNNKVDYLSSKDIIQEAGNGSRRFTIALFDDVAHWLHVNESANKSPKQNSSSAENESSSQVSPEIVVNTRVMSVSVVSRSGKNAGLEEKVRYTLKHKEKKSNGSKPMCVFWKYSTESFEGHWSDEGCRDVSNCLDCSYTVCECDHLTSFAVLMPVSGVDLGGSAKSTYRTSVGHEFALSVITYICCTISIICLALAFITFYWFKDLQCVRNTIHKNLVLCLFIAEVIFLLGIGQYEHKVLCAVVAGFLHYFFLASFSWMFLEGVQLYILLVKVFEARTSFRLRRYYLCGYGAPALIVFISAIVTYVKGNSYAAHHYCWLSTDDGLIWAFSGPATVIIFVNLVVLIVVICRIHTSKASSLRPEEQKSKTKTIASWVRGAIVLMVLLGTPWIVGFFYVNEESIFMACIFTILNSLQGFFIFVFHCLTCEKVQKEYRRCIQRCICLPGIRSG